MRQVQQIKQVKSEVELDNLYMDNNNLIRQKLILKVVNTPYYIFLIIAQKRCERNQIRQVQQIKQVKSGVELDNQYMDNNNLIRQKLILKVVNTPYYIFLIIAQKRCERNQIRQVQQIKQVKSGVKLDNL